MEFTFIPIAMMLALGVKFAGEANRKIHALILLLVSVAAFLINEVALRRYRPDYNIRVDLLILIPLALVVVSRLVFPYIDSQNHSEQSRQATACLTLSLISLVIWIFPLLAGIAIVKGHKALRSSLSRAEKIKVIIGLLLGYCQIGAAVYLWVLMP